MCENLGEEGDVVHVYFVSAFTYGEKMTDTGSDLVLTDGCVRLVLVMNLLHLFEAETGTILAMAIEKLMGSNSIPEGGLKTLDKDLPSVLMQVVGTVGIVGCEY